MTGLFVLVVLFESVPLGPFPPTTDGRAFFVIDLVNRVGVSAVPVESMLVPTKLLSAYGDKKDRLLVLLLGDRARIPGWCIGWSDEDGWNDEGWSCICRNCDPWPEPELSKVGCRLGSCC